MSASERRLNLSVRYVVAGVGLAIALTGCGGGGSISSAPAAPSVAPPTTSSTPGIPTSLSQTVRLGLAQTVTFGPIASGASGTVAFPVTSIGQGAVTISLQSALPPNVPAPTSITRRSISTKVRSTSLGASFTPLAYIIVTPSSAMAFASTPAFTFTFPAGVLTGYASLAAFDPANANLGWNILTGPIAASGTSVTLPGAVQTPPLALTAKSAYVFAIIENAAGPTPTPVKPLSIFEYPVPGAASYLNQIASGPDGNLWFWQAYGPFKESINKMTTAGVVTRYPLTTPPYHSVQGIAAGPDGNIWFTETAYNQVAKVTPDGVITEYPVTGGASDSHGVEPLGIAAGPDGNMWFTEPVFPINGGYPAGGGYGAVSKMTPSGAVTDYPFPIPPGTPPSSFAAGPQSIVAGADGNMWFTDVVYNLIGKVTTGGVYNFYPLPTANASPFGITLGPDGNVWFTEDGISGGQVGKITPSGSITEYNLGFPYADLRNITAGPDGNLWLTNEAGLGFVVRVTTDGVPLVLPIPTSKAGPYGIAAGSDGNIWFAEGGLSPSQLGKVNLH